MANLKWADVAGYYLKSGIEGIASPLGSESPSINSPIGLFDVSDSPRRKFTPILRHLEDRTEMEETELRRLETSDETIYRAYKRVYSPIALNFLISKGFDVFGLIESGQAIRKMESQPAEAQQQ